MLVLDKETVAAIKLSLPFTFPGDWLIEWPSESFFYKYFSCQPRATIDLQDIFLWKESRGSSDGSDRMDGIESKVNHFLSIQSSIDSGEEDDRVS